MALRYCSNYPGSDPMKLPTEEQTEDVQGMKFASAMDAANLQYWKSVARRYRRQRDEALERVHFLRNKLLQETGRAYDGHDYLRLVIKTASKPSWRYRLLFAIERLLKVRGK